jgi:hypothetical protein
LRDALKLVAVVLPPRLVSCPEVVVVGLQPGGPVDEFADDIGVPGVAVGARLSVLPGEPLPCGLLRHAKRLADASPADTPGAQDVHVVVHSDIDLGYQRLDPRQALEQLIIWPLAPSGDLRYRLLSEDVVAQFHAFIADVDARPRDQLGDCLFVLAAKRAAQDVQSAGACRGVTRSSHTVKVALTM